MVDLESSSEEDRGIDVLSYFLHLFISLRFALVLVLCCAVVKSNYPITLFLL